MGKTMDRLAILAIGAKRQSFAVSIPGWGGTIRLAVMTVGERSELENMVEDGKAPTDWKESVLARCIVDDDGKRLFETDEQQAELASLPSMGIDTLVREAMRINGIGADLGKND